MDSLFVLILIGCVIKLELCGFSVFNDEIIVYNDFFEMKYELECKYYCRILLSCIIDAATGTHAPAINLDSIVTGRCQTSRIGYCLFGVSSPTTIQNENKVQDNSDPSLPQTQIQSHPPPDTTFNFVPIVSGSRKFDDPECIFGISFSEDEFNCDTNNVFKYLYNKSFDDNYDCNMYCASDGMFVFQLFFFLICFFFSAHSKYASWYM